MRHVLTIIILMCLITFGASTADAQSRNPGTFGIGLGHGTLSSGLSFKHFAGPTALQATVGCWGGNWGYRGHKGYGGCHGLAGGLDLLFNMPALASSEHLTLAWNFGGGGAVGLSENYVAIGASFVLGLEINFQTLPLDLVLEWRPSLRIGDGFGLALFNLGAHIRFYLY